MMKKGISLGTEFHLLFVDIVVCFTININRMKSMRKRTNLSDYADKLVRCT